MIGIYDEISIGDILSRSKMQLRIVDATRHDDYLEILAYEALGSIKCLTQQNIQIAHIPFSNNTAQLPNGIIKILLVSINGTPLIYANKKLLAGYGCDMSGFEDSSKGWQIQKGSIYVNSTDGDGILDIVYTGLNTDENGFPLIYQRYERAIINYICYQYSLAYKEDFTNYQTEMWHRTWVEQKSRLEGEDVLMDFENNRHKIATLMNAIIVSRSYLK